ncbi:KGGVGR-motif variant AAA ATPase [Streptomyces sp. URMC 129]|uniref:KGGVGR-motif variant AAA ATPase n=1 Tax=Streptomyces sp. URMC 129 TaxID=3423407 RepID=UPI003F1D7463
MTPGQIITFYSYKGGVGRSFALANAAVLLARWGYRVLCVDWDLEAPGLAYFFREHCAPPTAGLLEMLEEVRDGGRPSGTEARTPVELPGGARLDLIAAGRSDDPGYVARLQTIDWDALYRDHDLGAVLEEWRARWMRDYDVVLVDSRTGITDAGGICTAQVPDVLVFVFTANQQNIDGVLDIVARAMDARDRLPYDRPKLLTVPLLSRFDAGVEYEQGETWRALLAERIAPRLRDWLPRGYDATGLLHRLTIPYFPIWSFGEGLPPLQESHSNSEQVTYSLATLAALLARRLQEVDLLVDNRDSYVEAAVRAARPAYEYDVYVGHSPTTRALAAEIIPLLRARGVRTFPVSPDDAPPPPDRHRALIDASRHFVVLADEHADPDLEQDLHYFLRQSVNDPAGRRTLPVVTSAKALRALPSVVSNIQSFNLARGSVAEAVLAIAAQVADETGEIEFGAQRPLVPSRFDALVNCAAGDRPWTRALTENLTRLGLAVWLDEREPAPGDSFAAAVEDGLSRADAIVQIVSRHSASGWLRQYARLAPDAQRLIPVLLDDVTPPPFLADRKFLDCRDISSPGRYASAVRELASAVSGGPPLRDARPAPGLSSPPLVPPPRGEVVHAALRVGPRSVVFSTARDELEQPPHADGEEFRRLLAELRRAREETDPRGRDAERPYRALLALGTALGDRFLGGPVGELLRGELEDARHRGGLLRLAVQVDEPEWADLPWEALVVPGWDRPLGLTEQVQVYRAVPGHAAPHTVPAPGPLRVLAVTAQPERAGIPLLDFEREMSRLADAVSPANGGARVRVLDAGTVGAIRAALEREPFHVLHVSCHAVPGALLLEDERGGVDEVDAGRFAAEILPAGRTVPLVVLSGCSTGLSPRTHGVGPAVPVPQGPARVGLARGLLAEGVPAVLAMTDDVTDRFAADLTHHFYRELVRADRPEPLTALSRARRAEEREHRGAWAEWTTPALFLSGAPAPLFDPADGVAPLPPPAHLPPLEDIVARGPGEVVGRRADLRRLAAAFRDSGRAGVVIQGIGGVGKSVLAAELIRRLGDDAGLVVPVPGTPELTAHAVLRRVGARLADHADARDLPADDPVRGAAGTLLDGGMSWQRRWSTVRQHVLPRVPVVLFLDGVEPLLSSVPPDDLGFADGSLAGLLWEWVTAAPRTKLLVTTRLPVTLPKRAHRRLTPYDLGPLTDGETLKLMGRLPGLDALSPDDRERVHRTLGGHPRALEYLDALLRGGEARFPDVLDRLDAALERRGIRRPQRWLSAMAGDLDRALADTVTLTAEDAGLADLVRRLDRVPRAVALFGAAAVYRIPVDATGIAWQVVDTPRPPSPGLPAAPPEPGDPDRPPAWPEKSGAPHPPVALNDDDDRGLDVLLDCGLIARAPAPQDEPGAAPTGFVVHRWIAATLDEVPADLTYAAAHRRAADYWRWRVAEWPQDRVADVLQLLEARAHHRAAGDLADALACTETVCEQLHAWGELDREERLVRESLTWFPEDSSGTVRLLVRLGAIAQRRGAYAAARARYENALGVAARCEDETDTGRILHRLGDLNRDHLDLDAAERAYRNALVIAEKAGDHPGIARAARELGSIAYRRGDAVTAERYHRYALTVAHQLRDWHGVGRSAFRLAVIAREQPGPGTARWHQHLLAAAPRHDG